MTTLSTKHSLGQMATTVQAMAFDMVQILAKAWAGGARTGPALADHLRELKDYQGALGTYSATGDNRFTLAAVVKIAGRSKG